MRTLYLIRHGHPDIPLGERWCLGRTDLPLAPVGRMQAALLPFAPELRELQAVFCSPLVRAKETAAAAESEQTAMLASISLSALTPRLFAVSKPASMAL